MNANLPGVKLSISHFGISCFDVPKMREFYVDVMGLYVSDEGSVPIGGGVDIVFMTTDPNDHHQFVLASGRTEAVESGAVLGGSIGSRVFQISFRLGDLPALRSIVERIRAYGIDNFTPVSHGNAWAVYTRDPEGNAVELFVDSPWYVAQPCAMPLDFTKSDEEILAETEAYCRAQPECVDRSVWSAELAQAIAAHQATL